MLAVLNLIIISRSYYYVSSQVHMLPWGRAIVFLNSSRMVNDLLEKRAAIYSSRPFRPRCQDIMSGGARMLLMPHR